MRKVDEHFRVSVHWASPFATGTCLFCVPTFFYNLLGHVCNGCFVRLVLVFILAVVLLYRLCVWFVVV